MDTFEIKIPYSGEQIATFKTVSDLGALVDEKTNMSNMISDDELNFFKVVTLGFFRLNLNGTCMLVDRDFENLVSIFNITAKDKGGKGKIDSTIRLSLKGEDDKNIYCECEVTRGGFIKRVEVNIEELFAPMLTNAIGNAMSHYVVDVSSKNFVYEPLVSPSEVGMEAKVVESLDFKSLSSLVASGDLRETLDGRAPIWVRILQFPANMILYPLNALRKFVFEI